MLYEMPVLRLKRGNGGWGFQIPWPSRRMLWLWWQLGWILDWHTLNP